jgi:hypothetical protein
MRPKSQHFPPSTSEQLARFDVPRAIPRNLLLPIVDVRLGGHEVIRAGVPKTSVNEYSDSSADEYQVGSSPKGLQRAGINAVSVPGGVNQSTNSEFRAGVSTPIALHALSCACGGGPRAKR